MACELARALSAHSQSPQSAPPQQSPPQPAQAQTPQMAPKPNTIPWRASLLAPSVPTVSTTAAITPQPAQAQTPRLTQCDFVGPQIFESLSAPNPMRLLGIVQHDFSCFRIRVIVLGRHSGTIRACTIDHTQITDLTNWQCACCQQLRIARSWR